LLSNPDPGGCSHFRSSNGAIEVGARDLDPLAAGSELAAAEKHSGRRFHFGSELGADDALEIMRARYVHLIGVLGSTGAGKTCFLSSLYLMASGGTLPAQYKFAGSLTLQAFEDRARGLREWKHGTLPGQLVDHTVLSDPRQPSLLHLAIRETHAERRRFDLLLTDLPGEWTDNLVLHAPYAESFRFLQRADGIILVVDGALLMSDQQRHVELQRMRYFSERLANDVNVSRDTPFVIAVSKSDEIDMQMPPAADELRRHVAALGFPATTISIAAFSRTPHKFKSGTGVFSAIETILSHPPTSNCSSSLADTFEPSVRAFGGFRG
jgi:hypothetical protein